MAGPTASDGADGASSAGGPVGEEAVGGAGASSAGGPVSGESSAGGPLLVAIPHPEPGRVRTPLRVPPGLVEAARWFVEQVKLPPQRGFGKVKERDGYRCTNPECGRLCLRNEAHHLVQRSEGGADEEQNGATVCRVCHLRGIHANKIAVVPMEAGGAEALLWTYPGGRRVLVFRSQPR
ncbi:MAG: HNH endonuclease [Deltaproteobacteria bacterium]|nr:HNH endonuclease [Deltaproteobacteria bacterium]